jgi:thioredoxin-related protein
MLAVAMAFAPVAAGAEMALVVVEQPGCIYCEAFDAEIAPAYPKTSEGTFAPLVRVQLRDLPDDITFASRPVLTPTFVVIEDGRELGRIEGYPGDLFFWPLLAELLRDEAGFAPEAMQ